MVKGGAEAHEAMDYEIVPYARDFDSQIAELQTSLWSSDRALNAAYLRWKYVENPFRTDRVLMQLALSGGRVVAMRGMFGSLWEVGDAATRHLFPHADDFVVAPGHRNRGVAHRIMTGLLAEAGRCGAPFAISFSVSPVTFVASLATGWRSAGSYRTVWSGTSASPTLERVRNRLRRSRGFAVLRRWYAGGHFRRLDRRAGSAPSGMSLARQPRPREMAELVARLPWDGRLRHVRDADYFAWRFRNPLSDYRFLYAGDRELKGYLVLQRFVSNRLDRGQVSIADWEAEDERTRAMLLDAALDAGCFRHLQTWTAGASEPVRTLLRDRAFQDRATGGLRTRNDGPLVRRLGAVPAEDRWTLGGRDVLDIASWDLRMLQSMAT
jgi:GNAT superfamily N-acetyltransferase